MLICAAATEGRRKKPKRAALPVPRRTSPSSLGFDRSAAHAGADGAQHAPGSRTDAIIPTGVVALGASPWQAAEGQAG